MTLTQLDKNKTLEATFNVGILGASGYGGAELLRRLQDHPHMHLTGIASRQYLGKPVSACWAQFADSDFADDLVFTDTDSTVADAEVLFSAAPHGSVTDVVAAAVKAGKKVVDLSADFRLPAADYEQWYGSPLAYPDVYAQSVYGLAELHHDEIGGASFVANPGCHSTAGALALAPLAAYGLLGKHIAITSTTGISGAGRGASMSAHYSELNENFKAYKVAGTHRHTAEIEHSLGRVQASGKQARTHTPFTPVTVSFNPHLAPMTRGILATAYTHPEGKQLPNGEDISTAGLLELYHTFYATDPLLSVQEDLPQTKATYGSDRVVISVRFDERSGHIIAFAAEDNLGKGAAGQAVQNFNLMTGLPETTGLQLRAVYP